MSILPDARLSHPSTSRNREGLLEVLRRLLPKQATVLEIASGSGEHATFFATNAPDSSWHPSDPDPISRASIDAWKQHLGVTNMATAIDLDVCDEWPQLSVDMVVCINMLHITPWAASLGLFAGAAQVLVASGLLITYGPYRIDGLHTAPSNERFEREFLLPRDARYGIRDLADLEAAAAPHDLELIERVTMPANNFTLVWRKKCRGSG